MKENTSFNKKNVFGVNDYYDYIFKAHEEFNKRLSEVHDWLEELRSKAEDKKKFDRQLRMLFCLGKDEFKKWDDQFYIWLNNRGQK